MDSNDKSKTLDNEIKQTAISTITCSYSTEEKLRIFANIIVDKLIQKVTVNTSQEENHERS